MNIIKEILIGSFWSFLLSLSGIIDIIIGILVFLDVIPVTEYSFLVSIICFGVGIIYLSGGLVIAVRRIKKKKK